MRVIIIGGSIAGVCAAMEIRKQLPNAEICLIEKHTTIGYFPDNLFQNIEGQTKAPLFLATKEELETVYQITIYTQTAVAHIVGTNCLQTTDGRLWAFDRLIIATGSGQFSRLLSDSIGWDTTMKEQEQQVALLEQINQAQCIAIVGAGLLGMAFASALHQLTKEVMIFERTQRPMIRYFDHEIGGKLQAQLAATKIVSHFSEAVDDIEQTAEGAYCLTTDQGRYQADLVLLAVNTRPLWQPFMEPLQENADGTIWVDEYLQTSFPNVFAIGDAIQVTFLPTEESIYLSSVANALRTAKVVSRNLVAPMVKDRGSVRPYTCQLFDHWYATVGMTKQEAIFSDRQLAILPIELPKDGHLHLIYDEYTQQVVGGQIEAPKMNQVVWQRLVYSVQQELTVTTCFQPDFFLRPLSASELADTEVGLDAFR